MMRSVHARRRLTILLMSVMGASLASASLAATPAVEASSPPAASSQQFVDGIAAVVNKQVITLKQVNTEVADVAQNLRAQGIPVPERSVLQRQVLQRMIIEELQSQEARRLGIRVTDAQVQRGIETIAERNNISPDELRKAIEENMPWERYLDGLRKEISFDLLRQRQVDSTISISDAEVDAFLRNQGRALRVPGSSAPVSAPPQQQTEPRILGLAQILVAVPEQASSAEVNQLQNRAEQLLAQVQAGADFAGLAASSSDGPQALEGGVLGVRPVEGWPDLFIEATKGLKAGQVSRVFRSGQGFHILKVLTRGEESRSAQAQPQQDFSMAGQSQIEQGPMIVTQTRARHILVRTNQITSDEQAEQRLRQLRDRLLAGESFQELARRHSDDATAPQGGDLGWLSPGETVPAFEQTMNSLQPGEISKPFKSPFGWHIVEVLERRNQDMGQEYQRMQARQILFQRRIEPAVDQWLNELYGEAYVDNRLDPQSNRNAQRR
ncbi:peptidylprolyl isomerase [Achromobacter sp. F4_2707]|uniref:peptidylprolyl isomerase n=1 Tax=Achromobacter sp. F4_2707 TaxID=3114286 RepID=UPI0039C6D9DC